VAVTLAEGVRQRTFAEPRRKVPRLSDSTVSATAPSNSDMQPATTPETETQIAALVAEMRQAYPSIALERLQKFVSMASRRQRGLIVVLENPDRLDAAAILRSCDSFGVPEVHFVLDGVKPFDPLANRQVYKSEGSNLWVCSRVFQSVEDCAKHLASANYTSVGLVPSHNIEAAGIFTADLNKEDKLAFWFGDQGVLSEKALGAMARKVRIPAASDADGLFVANTVAVSLAELVRQRHVSAHAAKWRISPVEQAGIVEWCVAVYLKRHPNAAQNTKQVADDQGSDGTGTHGSSGFSSEYQGLGQLREKLARQGW